MAMKIIDIWGREILDSRGNPTVEAEVTLENGIKALASVPSGASTGSREAVELRDGDQKRYLGQGVLKAVTNINTVIKEALVNQELNQVDIDQLLIGLDGSENKSKLGANACLAVSLACLKAGAQSHNQELYEYVSTGSCSLPIPMMNIINGGKHADNKLDIQEFMIVPVVRGFKERLRAGSEIFHNLKKILKNSGMATSVGDEGGFAPNLKSNEEALAVIMQAIKEAGYIPGKEVFIALDIAASEFYDVKTKTYNFDQREMTADELIHYYSMLIQKYPIVSIEDPFFENDFESLTVLTTIFKNKILVVGDDYFVTNKKYLTKAIAQKAGNAILLKANQVGTITEMIETIALAKQENYKMIISHRSGETEDTFIADLAVGFNIPYIKTGSLSRGERISKYNRLLRIEEKLTK
ncbi:MAG TPA: phosphopyruvate hydratase [Bacilli bacterium]|nr:phosphopyruvate hydratase [Bacilli bacterium]